MNGCGMDHHRNTTWSDQGINKNLTQLTWLGKKVVSVGRYRSSAKMNQQRQFRRRKKKEAPGRGRDTA